MVEFHLCHSLCGCGFFRDSVERAIASCCAERLAICGLKLEAKAKAMVMYAEGGL